MSDLGKRRRLRRLLGRDPVILLPLDDGLISGPNGWLASTHELLTPGLVDLVDGVLGFRGTLSATADRLLDCPIVLNVTASTILSTHTQKHVVAEVESAVSAGADALAFHLNVSSDHEGDGLANLGRVVESAARAGMPVIVIAYPRRSAADGSDDNYHELRSSDPGEYARLVRHTVRVAVELGADAVKTVFTGDAESFATVVDVAMGVPLLMAGGPVVSDELALRRAREAVLAGAAGVAFGRQVFMHDRPVEFLSELRSALAVMPS